MYIYIYMYYYMSCKYNMCANTYKTGERERERESETLPTIIPLQTVLIEMRGFQS